MLRFRLKTLFCIVLIAAIVFAAPKKWQQIVVISLPALCFVAYLARKSRFLFTGGVGGLILAVLGTPLASEDWVIGIRWGRMLSSNNIAMVLAASFVGGVAGLTMSKLLGAVISGEAQAKTRIERYRKSSMD